MCLQQYMSYFECGHADFYRLEYCAKAIALGLPERDDPFRGRQNPDNNEGDAAGASDLSALDAFSAPRRPSTGSLPTATGSRQNPGPSQHNQRPAGVSEAMATAQHAEAGPSMPWADVAAVNHAVPGADLIPRSVQFPSDASSAFAQGTIGSSSGDLHGMFHTLEIDFPLDKHSSVSVEVTHRNGMVKSIVSRFESIRITGACGETLSNGVLTDIGDARSRTSSDATVRHIDVAASSFADLVGNTGHTQEVSYHTSPSDSEVNWQQPPGSSTDEARQTVDHMEEDSPGPSRQLLPKASVPSLKTAQRAKEREEKRKAFHADPPRDAGRKTLRGTKSVADLSKQQSADTSITYLTKGSSNAVENDITSKPSPRSSTQLRQPATSSPLGSPTRSVLQRTTNSPGRTRASTVRGQANLLHLLTPDLGKESKGPSSTTSAVSSAATFHTAPPSPTWSSEADFHDASEHHGHSFPPLDLADEETQAVKSSDGMNPRFPHARGRSDPQPRFVVPGGKSTLTRPTAPKLALRIPPVNTQTTDRKCSPYLGSSSPASSPTKSSRIPRAAASTADKDPNTTKGTAGSRTALKKSMSSKALDSSKAAFLLPEPYDISLPGTPVVSLPSRHVQTVDSQGATPIISGKGITGAPEAVEALSDLDQRASEKEEPRTVTGETSTAELHGLGTVTLSEAAVKGDASAPTNIGESIIDLLSRPQVANLTIVKANTNAGAPQEASQETLKPTSIADDPVTRDPAIILARKRSIAREPALPESPLAEQTTARSASMGSSRTIRVYNTVPPRVGEVDVDAMSEPKIGDSRSDLRATAPSFVPGQPATSTYARPLLPPEWLQPQSDVTAYIQPLNPWPLLELDNPTNWRTTDFLGFPAFQALLQFQHNDTTALVSPPEFLATAPVDQSPTRRKKKAKGKGKQQASQNEPTVGEPSEQSTPRGTAASLDRLSLEDENMMTGNEDRPEVAARDENPFASQFDIIRRLSGESGNNSVDDIHATDCAASPTAAPSQQPQTQLSVNASQVLPHSQYQYAHPVPGHAQRPYPVANTGRGNPYTGRGNQWRRWEPGMNYIHRRPRTTGAGVPLNATAPFPDPVFPPGRPSGTVIAERPMGQSQHSGVWCSDMYISPGSNVNSIAKCSVCTEVDRILSAPR